MLLAAAVCDLELQGIRKLYDGVARPVIPNLDLTIPSKKMVVLVGPSGCGKSTTLRMVAGLEEPTAGTILIDGRDVTNLPPAERDIAMVFQSYALYPHMTVFENMAFGLRIKNLPEGEIKRRVVDGRRSRSASSPTSSAGRRRSRAASASASRSVARSCASRRCSCSTSRCRTSTRSCAATCGARSRASIRARRRPAMYVTHDQIEAMTLADQIVVLKDGVVQQIGTPVEIYEQPANRFVAGFFGTPTMNFLSADLAQTGEQHAARGPGFEIPLALAPSLRPAQSALDRIVVGIRPERLSLEKRGERSQPVGRGRDARGPRRRGRAASRVRCRPADGSHRRGLGAAPRRHRAGVARSASDPRVRRRRPRSACESCARRSRVPRTRGMRASGREHGVVLWHAYTGLERTALETTAAQWNAAHPDTPLVLVAVPYDSFADKLTSAIPRGNGPDLFIYPHDRIGDWADAGTIEPIEFWVDDARADRFTEQAIGAMAYRGSLWGLPLSVKSLALYVRTDLVATPPDTTDELDRARARDEGEARASRSRTRTSISTATHRGCTASAARVMDDDGKLAITTREAADAMTFARKLVADGVAPARRAGPARREPVQRRQGRDRDVGPVVRRRHREERAVGGRTRCRSCRRPASAPRRSSAPRAC